MNRLALKTIFSLGIALGLTIAASAQTESFVLNFEEFATGPSLFDLAGDAQELEIPGRVTASGGVILGFPTNFPAINFATAPNTYSTTNGGPEDGLPNLGDGFLPTLTLEIDEDFEVFQVEGILFNGVTSPQSYFATSFSGTEINEEQTFDNLASNLEQGNAIFAFASDDPITRIEIGVLDTTFFVFGIDTIAFNQSIENAFEESVNPPAVDPPTTAIPSPAALPLGLLMLGGLLNRRRR